MPGKGKKKTVDGGLGRTMLKRALRDKRERREISSTGFHVADLEQSNNPLQSVTMLSSLEDFVAGAVLSERSFAAERVQLSFVPDHTPAVTPLRPAADSGGLVDVSSGVVRALQIPRRPRWNAETTAEALHRAEKDAFIGWRRMVASVESALSGGVGVSASPSAGKPLTVTPFEKNIEVWRQLWRVVERSDVLVQIVDARNPLLFHSSDLDAYVHEVSADKRCLLLVNKADFLSSTQRLAWARYLSARGIQFVFFSAKRELDRLEELDRAQALYVAGCGTSDLVGADTEFLRHDAGAAGAIAVSDRGSTFTEAMRHALDSSEGSDSEAGTVIDAPQAYATYAASQSLSRSPAIAGSSGSHPSEPPLCRLSADAVFPEDSHDDPSEPLHRLTRILSREELLEHLQSAGAAVPRGVFGSGSEFAQRKARDHLARLRFEATAARKEELRRRRDVAARLVSVGLGSQLRFAGAVDVLGLEGDEDEGADDDSSVGEHSDAEVPPLTVGCVFFLCFFVRPVEF
jgi:hypothetical protein